MIFTLANFNSISAQTVEDQYWDAVKNSKNVEDFKSYLKEYPNGKYASLARLKVRQNNSSTPSFLSFKVSNAMTNEAFMERWENQMRNQLPIRFGEDEIYRAAAPTSVENYFYTSVRTPNLTNVNIRTQANALKAKLVSDYCKSEAYQRKITVVLGYRDATSGYSKHIAPRDCNSNTSSNASFLSFKASSSMTNMAFMKRWENQLKTQLPITIGEYQIHRAVAPTSVENYFYTRVRTPSLSSPTETKIKARKLSAKLLSDYCKSDAYKRKITVVLSFKYNNGNGYSNHLSPAKCSTKTTSTPKKTNAEYLKSWASEVRVGLPEMVGNFQLTDAWSRCPNGCKETDNSPYLLLKFKALNNQRNTPIDQLKKSLMPDLLEEYCQTEAATRKIDLGIFFDNRGPQANYNNFWVRPQDCSAKTSQ